MFFDRIHFSVFLLKCFLSLAFLSAFFETLASITDFAVPPILVLDDLSGGGTVFVTVGTVVVTVGRGEGLDGNDGGVGIVISLFFFSGFCSKG